MATEILYRLPYSIVVFDVRLCFGILDGGYYALTETEIIANSTVHGRHPKVFDSCEEEQIHRVSLLLSCLNSKESRINQVESA